MFNKIIDDLKEIETADECRLYLRNGLRDYKTLYSENYSDYDKTEFYETIKVYENNDENDFIIVITYYDENKVSKIEIAHTNEKPRKPHPIFPLVSFMLKDLKTLSFSN